MSSPEPSSAKCRVERVGQVAHRQHDLVDAVRGEPGELTLEERLVRDRQQRLRRRERQRPQPRSLAADEDDRFHGFDVGVVCRRRRAGVGSASCVPSRVRWSGSWTRRHRRRPVAPAVSLDAQRLREVRHRRRVADARERLARRQERDHDDVALEQLVASRGCPSAPCTSACRSCRPTCRAPTAGCPAPLPHLSPFFTVVPRNVKPVDDSFQPPNSK